MDGFALVQKSDGVRVQEWQAIPARIEFGDLRLDSASAGWGNEEFEIVACNIPDQPTPVPDVMTPEQKLQNLGLTVDDLRAVLGI